MRDITYKLQDLTSLSWDEKTVTSGTGGTFLKSKRETSRVPVYYKLSRYDFGIGIHGHESVNELVVSRILDLLAVPHVPYKLVHALVKVRDIEYETWLSESRDYRVRGERRQRFETYYELTSDGIESPLEFALSHGWGEQVYQMMAIDYLIINRDRHGANFEVVFKDDGPEFSPLYDHGLSFVCTCEDEGAVVDFNPMKEYRCYNYIASSYSVSDNLKFIPKGVFRTALASSDVASAVLKGLNGILPQAYLEKIEEIISCRWNQLVDLGIIEVSNP